ncbi:hypothetical protein [Undibacterium sp.]|uniref:dCTP deaminase n=1 Tax=Undibacterium sp. TaxID=1914977 RepID=UPI0027307457|nr:hypothetical protein [Undibacterium sp.]MDP1979479.1 hypothetical protein [Undibacterium sp.]
MIIIEKNLEQLTQQYGICDRSLVDDFSLKVQLGNHCYRPKIYDKPVVFGLLPNPTDIFHEKETLQQNLVLKPGEQLITCSKHIYKIPLDYFGLLQTKGTLARLFVVASCNDGQIEPGFEGYITFELVNHSPWVIEIPSGSDIAQMYLIKCSSPAENAYKGRYSEVAKQGATIPIFNI